MSTEIKTPVDIIQEVIVLNTTRKEAVEKLSVIAADEEQRKRLAAAASQSEQFITALMNELSTFGDAVQGTPERDNDYVLLWGKIYKNIDEISGANVGGAFDNLQEVLTKTYGDYINKPGLPDTLQKLLVLQKQQL